MKNKLSLVIGAMAVMAATPVIAASTVDLTSGPGVRTQTNVNYQKYQTRTSTKNYDAQDSKNLYYTTPAKRSNLYTSRADTYRTEMKRKYFLAHPFFQPVKGKFGSVTDLSYNMNSYAITLNQTLATPDTGLTRLDGEKFDWKSDIFTIKEDFSYGITDTVAMVGMLKLDIAKYKFDWQNYPDDKVDDTDLNVFGIGVQWRFVDNEDWIATVSGYYQHQKDISNNFILDLKGGYKVQSTTIYALGRLWYLGFDGNSYGNALVTDAATMYIPYKIDDSAVLFEGGFGVFSVLDEDWTLNVEALFGAYDWHNQGSIKAAVGWQPNDWVALNLYVKTAVYDSADGKNFDLCWQEPAVGWDNLTKIGTVDMDDYSETSFGLQAIFMF